MRSVTPLRLVIPCLAALLFFAVLFVFYPHRTIFQADTDEGVNLIKARLVESGYPLYQEIWSDQPPAFTLALAQLFGWMEQDLHAARNLVLVLASLLVGCLAYFVQKVWGVWAALLCVFLALLAPSIPALSTSVMIGLPAIALAGLSLASLTAWHSSQRFYWLLVSGVLLGFSVMTKLFTGLLAPIFLAGICIEAALRVSRAASYAQSGAKPWRAILAALLPPALLWSAAFGLVVAGFTLLVIGPAHLAQLIVPHLAAGETSYNPYSFWNLLSGALPLLALALLGGWNALRRKRWLACYPLAWMGSAFIFLAFHTPIWYHQLLLITVPACILAAGALGDLFEIIGQAVRRERIAPWNRAYGLVVLGLAVALVWLRLPPVLDEFNHQPYFIALQQAHPAREQVILDEIAPYQPHAHWMFTDLPMYAFRAEILVPPELAVLTSKRLISGELSHQELARLVAAYQPEIILLGRFDLPELTPLLASRYILYSQHLDTQLYFRSDLPDLR